MNKEREQGVSRLERDRERFLSVLGLIALWSGSANLARYAEWIVEKAGAASFDLKDCPINEIAQRLDRDWTRAEEQIAAYRERGISVVPLGSSAYPTLLAHIYGPPPVLFVQGLGVRSVDAPAVAIVGARKGDAEGCDIASRFACELAKAGLCIISGLAYGIDTAAHRGSLHASGAALPTIAVLGGGFDHLYPAANRELAGEILEKGGLLVSQYEAHERPYPNRFLERNRTIAGMSHAVIVVQAAARSGSLATARYALEEGRDVLAVPGSISNPYYEGSNRLLRAGAAPAMRVEDIFEALPEWVRPKTHERPIAERPPLNETQSALVAFLTNGARPFEEIRSALHHVSDLESNLLMLEVDDVVQRLPGNMVALRVSV